MLDSGEINDSKQLSNLQHELESLAKRQLDLEDVELEVMERVEGAKAAVRQQCMPVDLSRRRVRLFRQRIFQL